ncbi:antifreeze protein [Pseudochrobactrum algeriensis]|uniref:antifreeze protein n=1 Tax=Pseudochrobactrum algeriensis TaxID=2834768 RepID=UPI001BCC8E36|nr:antifreeze protein [Pseudochrobactrum algeriensis]MBX8811628.1 antifreeze protein [Ochrobactrum sp. MR34]QVQ35924.1 antifreeze protein [Pseudochrobactrum algeriensis]QVQ39142.1 antifreeze protein [Pseudochrobactrum algeriensis]QVQ43061.1 antifreeze protein [Pseudochrobactrum algeriensis]
MSGFSMKAAIVSGLIGLAGVFSAGASAQAASPAVSLAVSGVATTGARLVQVNHRHGHYNRPQYRPNRYSCTPRNAVSKASRMGIRGMRVHSNRSTIRVSGYRHGRPVSVLFGKARGCPILR